MTKPTVFFSHASADKDMVLRLKRKFVEKTGGAIDVFVSSDGESIPLGRNWVSTLEDRLRDAQLVLVLLTPASIESKWIYFEAGFSYSKDTEVVPIGMLGVDLGRVPPPLGLLQGFNVTSAESLDNIIVVANRRFGHSHAQRFTAREFDEIVAAGDGRAGSLTRVLPYLDVVLSIWRSEDLQHADHEGTTAALREVVAASGMVHSVRSRDRFGCELRMPGIEVAVIEEGVRQRVEWTIDPLVLDEVVSLVARAAYALRRDGVGGMPLVFRMAPHVGVLGEPHQVTARVCGDGDEVAFGSEGGLSFRGLGFEAYEGAPNDVGVNRAFLRVAPLDNDIDLADVAALIELLVERRVFVPDA
jgi:hypothetical protein